MNAPVPDAVDAWRVKLHHAAHVGDEDTFLRVLRDAPPVPAAKLVDTLTPLVGAPRGIGRLAAWGLVELGAEAVPALLELLQGEDPAVCKHAAWALGSFRQEAVGQALLRVLSDVATPKELQASCLEALIELALPATQARLIELLPGFQDPRAVALACRALGRAGDAESLTVLVPCLTHPVPDVAACAAEACVRIGDERGWPVLFTQLHGDEPFDGEVAAALRSLGDLSSTAPLLLGKGDHNYAVRRQAAEILGALGDPRALRPLLAAREDSHPGVRGAVAYALGRLGDRRAAGPLGGMLKDPSEWVRMCAARALGLLGDPSAARWLRQVSQDPSLDVQQAVAEALRQLES